jgi:hypothetical protein
MKQSRIKLLFFFFIVVVVMVISCAKPAPSPAPTPTPSPASTQVPIPTSAGSLSLVDAHDHITPGLAAQTIISLMDQAGVNKMVAMANRIPPSQPIGYEESLVLAVYEKYPLCIIPFLTTVRWGWHFRGATFLNYAERQLQTGKFKGMGEFMVKHYAVPPLPGETASPEINVPIDSQAMRAMMLLGAKYNVPLCIHMETTSETLAALDRALTTNKNTKVIWAHQNPVKTESGSGSQCARKGDTNQVAALMDKHPNLFADISLGYELAFFNPTLDWQLPESWKNLYEMYNYRFMVGFDRAYKTTFEKGYLFQARWHRMWLSQLSMETARKLAFENAERLLLGK